MVSARRGRGPRAGLTIVEVMMAMMVTLIGLAGSLAGLMTLLRGAEFARRLTEASELVQAQMEALVPLTGVTLTAPPSGTTVEVALDGLGRAGGPYSRSTTWAVSPDGLRRVITVTVSWTDALGAPHGVTALRERAP